MLYTIDIACFCTIDTASPQDKAKEDPRLSDMVNLGMQQQVSRSIMPDAPSQQKLARSCSGHSMWQRNAQAPRLVRLTRLSLAALLSYAWLRC